MSSVMTTRSLIDEIGLSKGSHLLVCSRWAPNPDVKSRWLAGQADWEDILQAYKEKLEDREQLQISFE